MKYRLNKLYDYQQICPCLYNEQTRLPLCPFIIRTHMLEKKCLNSNELQAASKAYWCTVGCCPANAAPILKFTCFILICALWSAFSVLSYVCAIWLPFFPASPIRLRLPRQACICLKAVRDFNVLYTQGLLHIKDSKGLFGNVSSALEIGKQKCFLIIDRRDWGVIVHQSHAWRKTQVLGRSMVFSVCLSMPYF